MYNKLFSSIVNSSVWLQSNETRIVWLTLLATMDEDGFCQFATPANLAHCAIISPDKAIEAIKVLESPDEGSSDPANGGRRIERVPGGWMVLNAKKYKDLATRQIVRKQTKERVAEYRRRNGDVTHGNGQYDLVTPSETETETETNKPLSKFSPFVHEIFNHYIKLSGRSPKAYTLTAIRHETIERRFKECLVKAKSPQDAAELVKLAITNLFSSSFHLGKNDTGKKYIDLIDHCLKSYERMEKWWHQ